MNKFVWYNFSSFTSMDDYTSFPHFLNELVLLNRNIFTSSTCHRTADFLLTKYALHTFLFILLLTALLVVKRVVILQHCTVLCKSWNQKMLCLIANVNWTTFFSGMCYRDYAPHISCSPIHIYTLPKVYPCTSHS